MERASNWKLKIQFGRTGNKACRKHFSIPQNFAERPTLIPITFIMPLLINKFGELNQQNFSVNKKSPFFAEYQKFYRITFSHSATKANVVW